jgi:hypothetical protein
MPSDHDLNTLRFHDVDTVRSLLKKNVRVIWCKRHASDGSWIRESLKDLNLKRAGA